MIVSRRVGSKSKFTDAAVDDVESLARAKLEFGGDNLSLYWVECADEITKIMLLYAATNLESVQKVDWISFSDEILEPNDFKLIFKPDDRLHPLLSARHVEITSDTEYDAERLLISVIQSDYLCGRIQKSDAKVRVIQLATADLEFRRRLLPNWYRLLSDS